jgi:ABC-type multidrug transport system fused ATPase/permease subunit
VAGLRDAIEFDGVSFAYGEPGERGEPVLSEVTFRAARGDVVALVGASGAGKSTPRRPHPALPRAHRRAHPARRRRTRASCRLAELRAITGIVSQDTVLFNDTVRANIAYGAADRYTDAQVEAAARAANAHGFIGRAPAGLRDGARRARHAALGRAAAAHRDRARAPRGPADPHPRRGHLGARHRERAARAGGDRPPPRRPHRLRDRAPPLHVVGAAQILVLDRGRIVERGTHAELLARRGGYWRLHSLQFGDRAEVGV